MKKDRDAATEVKLPKRIGGIKVPKKLRKTGTKLVAKAASPLGLELIAAGLSLAASAAAEAAARHGRDKNARGGSTAGQNAPESSREPSASARAGRLVQPPKPSNDPHEIGVALGRMAEAALAGFLRPKA